MKTITSWDDGHILDLKIAELLRKYKLSGIFYLCNATMDLNLHQIKELSNDFEIGGHTLTHPEDMKTLTDDKAYQEIYDNKKWLEYIIGKEIDSFCYPKGRYNENTVEIVKKCGYKNARTTLVLNSDLPTNPYRVQTTIHFANRKEYNGRSALETAIEQFEIAKKKDGYFHIWGHSLEVEKLKLWGDLEKLFKYIYENNSN